MFANLNTTVILGGILSVMGTMLGSLAAVFLSKPSKDSLAFVNGISSGIMIAITVFDLIPESLTRLKTQYCIFYIAIGFFFMYLISILYEDYSGKKSGLFKTALFTSLGLMLHNLPEGIIMGVGFISSASLGIRMSVLICIHDIPEGLAVASSLVALKKNIYKVLMFSFLTALPTIAGVIIGLNLKGVGYVVIGVLLSIVSGIMLYVVFFEMLRSSIELSSRKNIFFSIMSGILLGLVIIIVL